MKATGWDNGLNQDYNAKLGRWFAERLGSRQVVRNVFNIGNSMHDEHETLTFHPLVSIKDSNPKDAIGDTKIPLWLCSPIAKAHWAIGQYSGMLKYGSWNWRVAGVRSSVYLSAMQRHIDAYISGEEFDPVDGSHHLGNVMACCAILLDAKAAGKLTDDRPPSVELRSTYYWGEDVMARLKRQYSDKAPRHYTIKDTA